MHLPKLTVNSLDFMYFLLLRARYEFNLHGLTITLPTFKTNYSAANIRQEAKSI